MHRRLLRWLLVGLLLTSFIARSQTPAAAPTAAGQGKFNQNGVILVAKFSGKVDIIVDGVAKQAAIDMVVPPKGRVVTAQGASVVLVFSNGASTQLGSDSDLVIEEFLQDPLAAMVKVAEMVDEPSPSRTKLMLSKGELVGNVKKLKYDQGSSFTVQTPVGAAGIRGTTFRIVFRPNGTGQAFFTLTTATGQVEFTQPNQNNATQSGPGTNQPGGGNTDPNSTQTSTTTTTGTGTAAVQVPQGQELVIIDVQVTTNSQGQLVVVAMPQGPKSTSGAAAANMEAVVKVAQDIAVATQNTTFATPAPTNPSNPQQGSTQGGGTSGDGGSGTPGPTTGTTTTTTTTGTTTTTTTTKTASVSGESFTGSTTTTTTTTVTTPPPNATQATRGSTISSGP